MLEEKYIKIINEIINHYGKEKQVLQAIEELCELILALIKNINRNKDNKSEITLEMADVTIMLSQLNDIYKIDKDELLGGMEYKLLRQKERIENESKTELN